MSLKSRVFLSAVLFLYLTTIAIPHGNAYIDPGSGSYLFQLLIGGLLGAGVAIKVFWRRIWGFLTRRSVRRAPGPAVDSTKED